MAFRHELSDNDGSYTGTFVSEVERWQVGDVFTTGDGRALRITAISASEKSIDRPAYTDRWNVEAAGSGGCVTAERAEPDPGGYGMVVGRDGVGFRLSSFRDAYVAGGGRLCFVETR